MQAQEPVEAFYKGKTIDLYIGYSAGGGYDAYARLVAQHMNDHIPGMPRIVPHNMPGAASRIAAGYVFSVAPQDGTALGTADQALALEQATGDKAIPFDVGKLNWIGNPDADNNVVFVWRASGVSSIEQAKNHEVTLGASGGGTSTSAQFAKAMNALLGTKFKIILGYSGGADVNLAMERGEVEGRGSSSWVSLKSGRPDWLRENKVAVLVQIGLTKASDLPNVPLLMDLTQDADSHAVLRLLSTPVAIGRPIFTGPNVPAERVNALRAAFDATMKDPAFRADAAKEHLDLNPVSGGELQEIVAGILASPPRVIARLSAIIGPAGKKP